jgi:predicted ATP-grasp superfamily ATP-dependent carboligase
VIYTGGLENYPSVVAELARDREVWGNGPEVLARVRDPHTVFPLLTSAHFTTPRLTARTDVCPQRGLWLRKPRASGGGLGIRLAQPGELASDSHCFQEFVAGVPMSALFLGDPHGTNLTAQVHLIGFTEQLIGEPWLHAPPFAYCGNIGPIPYSHELQVTMWHRAAVFNAKAGLRGLWGLDFLADGESACILEVNPRYTAALEVLELAWRCSFVWSHSRCFTDTNSLQKKQRNNSYDKIAGKAIYYAPHAIRFPTVGPWDADLAGEFDPWSVPRFADIPDAGATLERGWPVLTFFARAESTTLVREQLQQIAGELDLIFSECKT